MKFRITCYISILLVAAPAFAAQTDEKDASGPNASFGFVGTFSEFNVWQKNKGKSYTRYDFSPGYGGGIVFEKMFNNHLGIQSGLLFTSYSLEVRMRPSFESIPTDPTAFIPFRFTFSGWMISLPVSLLASINASFFSLNFLVGVRYTHIIKSEMRVKNPQLSYKKHVNLLPYVNQPQFGFTAGINFRFRVAQFVDLFFGASGGLYVTELLKDGDDTSLLFDLMASTGFLFRTNLFPAKN